jgi:hypothetical protein
MNNHDNDTKGLDSAATRTVVRAAAGALFVGVLLGIGASALGRGDPPQVSAKPATPYSADHAKITEAAEPIATF